MTYKRKLALLRDIEKDVESMAERHASVTLDDIGIAVLELRKLIEAEKPEPRWYCKNTGRSVDLWRVYDRTLGDAADSQYVAIDEMAADVIVRLLNEAEERTDE